ncbi:IPT/TIG domain-containing protein [Solwaraspora sp. WMMD791]|uniref:IPT/TIG domain-containing protein n=1 Tax=Solwaraspora sp. WMMD791 TaxID=3016086 RepID=UPI00249C1749|nr:IPT/TIG domain-containing protein [Solwaraspora sp. WMMD791]WFE26788.1 IPT/TIG domain-containing protein [Solwaraspora sp. WMMD791]
MSSTWDRTAALTLAALLGIVSGLAVITPALAASGDARARGAVVSLDAEVLGRTVISANLAAGVASAPIGGGTDSKTSIAIDAAGAVGVTTGGTVTEVTATKLVGGSLASSSVAGLSLAVLGLEVLTVAAADASVSCPATGGQRADTTLAGLTVFGEPVTLLANRGGGRRWTAAVTVDGLGNGNLVVTLSRTESVTADGASAATVTATLQLTGEIAGSPVVIPVGTVVVAEASCARAVPPSPTYAIDPDAGRQSGGESVTITGTGFVPGGTSVTFDGVAATHVVVKPSGTSLTAVTPAGPTGPADVLVSTAGATTLLRYTYLADGSDAVVTGLNPDSGWTSSGSLVDITGRGFEGATGVTFAGVPGTDFRLSPAGTVITLVPPQNPAGPAAVEIVFPAGVVHAGTFTYNAPYVDFVTPGEVPNTGNELVWIGGGGLLNVEGVTFGGVPVIGRVEQLDWWGALLRVIAPPGPLGPVDVVVQLPGPDAVLRNAVTYVLGPPAAYGIHPRSGPLSGGQTVTITGARFVPGGTSVTFNGVPATDVVVDPSGSSLTAVTPPGRGWVQVAVTTANGTTFPLNYAYLLDGSDAAVTDLYPRYGPTEGGTLVTIAGRGFEGATDVTFGGVAGAQLSVDSAGTSITVATPPGVAGPADVAIVFPAGVVDAGTFRYGGPPIDAVSPDSGPNTGGTTVTVTGSGLADATDVTFGGVPGTNLVVDPSGTSLTVVTPPGPLGPVDVVVVLPGDDAVAPDAFTYTTAPAPVIESVDPGQGPANGGATVVVAGSGFIPGQTTVTICGRTIPAGDVTVDSSGTSLSFVTPSCGVEETTITVATPNGTSNEIAFRYVGLPVTGSATTNLITSGAALMVMGVALLLLTRRRATMA